jgi:hypothetical protein
MRIAFLMTSPPGFGRDRSRRFDLMLARDYITRSPAPILRSMGEGLPGEDLIEAGLADLSKGVSSIEALLVSIGAPRLRRIGLQVSSPIPSPERKLYELLAESDADSAHGRYNALVRRLVSFERAAECAAK